HSPTVRKGHHPEPRRAAAEELLDVACDAGTERAATRRLLREREAALPPRALGPDADDVEHPAEGARLRDAVDGARVEPNAAGSRERALVAVVGDAQTRGARRLRDDGEVHHEGDVVPSGRVVDAAPGAGRTGEHA